MAHYENVAGYLLSTPTRNRRSRPCDDDPPSPDALDSGASSEELFYLEMSDEGSGGKRSKLDHKTANNYLCDQMSAPPQKRGAGQPLATSVTDAGTKKARKMGKPAPEETSVDDDPDMAKEALSALLAREQELMSGNCYEKKILIHECSEIRFEHRVQLLEWLFKVNLNFGYSTDTWVLTACILDRFMALVPMRKDVFQLSGLVSFLIVAKHEERDPPRVRELVTLCQGSYEKMNFITMERLILNALKWRIFMFPTLNKMIKEVVLVEKKHLTAEFYTQIMKKIVLHRSLAYMPPSRIVFTLVRAVDGYADACDVERIFRFMLYLLKIEAPYSEE